MVVKEEAVAVAVAARHLRLGGLDHLAAVRRHRRRDLQAGELANLRAEKANRAEEASEVAALKAAQAETQRKLEFL